MFTSCVDYTLLSPHVNMSFFGLKKETEHTKWNHLVPLPAPFPILELKKKEKKKIDP